MPLTINLWHLEYRRRVHFDEIEIAHLEFLFTEQVGDESCLDLGFECEFWWFDDCL